ncbi:MAG TPA: hypothetical protein VG711_05705 [Phycisphaerales bacterium]|nr:hypothetical protein [Phycisphaerales bacterium]
MPLGFAIALLATGQLLEQPIHARAEDQEALTSQNTPPIQQSAPSSELSATAPASAPDYSHVYPPAKELLKRLRNAMGGEEKLDAVKSTHTTTHISSQYGEFDWDVKTIGDDRLLFVQTEHAAEKDLVEVMGIVDHICWYRNAVGQAGTVQAQQLRDMRLYIDLPNVLRNMWTYFKDIKTVDDGTFEGRPCYKLSCTEMDDEITIVHIDKETGLCLGFELIRGGPIIFTSGRVTLGDWKDFNGYKMFTTMTHAIDDAKPSTIHINEFEVNTVPDGAIEIPADLPPGSLPATQPAASQPSKP